MKLLLDSHVFLWLLFKPELVTSVVRATIQSAAETSVSVVSLWELALKHRAGKLPHDPSELSRGVDQLNLQVELLRAEHIVQLAEVKLSHKDPFDQILIAQCQSDRLQLVTADAALLSSGYATIDARS